MPSYPRRRSYRRIYRRSRSFASSRVSQLPPKTVSSYGKAAVHVYPAGEALTTVAVSSVSSPIHLNAVPRGSGSAERIGSRYKMRYLFMNYALNPPSGSNVPGRVVRFAVVYDRRPTGVAPTVVDIFGDSDPLFNVRLDAADRFKVLYIKNHLLIKSPVATSTYETGIHAWKTGKLKIPVFRETSMTQADITGGHANCLVGNLWFVASTSYPSAIGSDPTIVYTYRLSFVDIV